MQKKQQISEITIVVLYMLSFVGVHMMSEQEVNISVCRVRSESIIQGSILSFHIVEAGFLLLLLYCVLQLVLKLLKFILSHHHLHIALGILKLKVQSHSDFFKTCLLRIEFQSSRYIITLLSPKSSYQLYAFF